MRQLNERLALLLFSGAATPLVVSQAFSSGSLLATGLGAVAVMLLALVAVQAIVTVMRAW